jgi:hypothetical protein
MILTYFYGLAAALALAGAVHTLFLILLRRPILGHKRASELSEMERGYDRDLLIMNLAGRVPTPADIPFKPVLTRVQYEVGGVAYTADVTLLTLKGDRPESLPTLWYDPRDPHRVTGIGPLWGLGLLALAGAIAIAGPRFRSEGDPSDSVTVTRSVLPGASVRICAGRCGRLGVKTLAPLRAAPYRFAIETGERECRGRRWGLRACRRWRRCCC